MNIIDTILLHLFKNFFFFLFLRNKLSQHAWGTLYRNAKERNSTCSYEHAKCDCQYLRFDIKQHPPTLPFDFPTTFFVRVKVRTEWWQKWQASTDWKIRFGRCRISVISLYFSLLSQTSISSARFQKEPSWYEGISSPAGRSFSAHGIGRDRCDVDHGPATRTLGERHRFFAQRCVNKAASDGICQPRKTTAIGERQK